MQLLGAGGPGPQRGGGSCPGPIAIVNTRVPVDLDVRWAIEGGLGQYRVLAHVLDLVSLVGGALLTPGVGEVVLGIRPADGGW